MPSTQFNFQQGRYDGSYADSLANLSKDFSTIGVQQGRVAQDAINEANNLAYRNARAKAQDEQSAIQNQLSYDNLGINKEKIAIDQYNTKSKNQAAYNTLVQSGRIKEPMQDNVDYSTMFDSLVKNDVTKANIAQSNAAINASNANAASANAQADYFKGQVKAEEDFYKGYVNTSTPQIVTSPNPAYINIQNEYNKVNEQIKGIESGSSLPKQNSNAAWLDNMNSKITSLEQLKNTTGLNSGQESQLKSMLQARSNVVNSPQNTKVVPSSLVSEQQRLADNLKTVPQTIQEQRLLTKKEAYNKIVNDTTLSNPAKYKLLNKLNDSEDASDSLDGLSNTSSKSSGSSGGIKFGKLDNNTGGNENSLSLMKYAKSLQADKESNAVTINKIAESNPSISKEEADRILSFKSKQGLDDYYSMNYDKDTGLFKNSAENKLTIAGTSLRNLVAKNTDDTDNNSIANIDQFLNNNNNKKVLTSMTPKELDDFMSGVSTDYSKQGTSFIKNLSDNSPIGDALDNRIELWNQIHPDKQMKKEHIGNTQFLGIFGSGDQGFGN